MHFSSLSRSPTTCDVLGISSPTTSCSTAWTWRSAGQPAGTKGTQGSEFQGPHPFLPAPLRTCTPTTLCSLFTRTLPYPCMGRTHTAPGPGCSSAAIGAAAWCLGLGGLRDLHSSDPPHSARPGRASSGRASWGVLGRSRAGCRCG